MRGQNQKQEGGSKVTKKAHFGVKSYSALMQALVHSEAELDVELLLMLRSDGGLESSYVFWILDAQRRSCFTMFVISYCSA